MVIVLTLESGRSITLHLIGNFAVLPNGTGSTILDGVHNNGGWCVKESYDEVTERIILLMR